MGKSPIKLETLRERDKGNDMEEGGKYLLPSCSRDHQVGEPILFYGNPAPPLGAYNSRRVPEGATQRYRFRENKESGGIRIKGFILKRMDGEKKKCREILRDEIYISAYLFFFVSVGCIVSICQEV